MFNWDCARMPRVWQRDPVLKVRKRDRDTHFHNKAWNIRKLNYCKCTDRKKIFDLKSGGCHVTKKEKSYTINKSANHKKTGGWGRCCRVRYHQFLPSWSMNHLKSKFTNRNKRPKLSKNVLMAFDAEPFKLNWRSNPFPSVASLYSLAGLVPKPSHQVAEAPRRWDGDGQEEARKVPGYLRVRTRRWRRHRHDGRHGRAGVGVERRGVLFCLSDYCQARPWTRRRSLNSWSSF